MPHWQPPAHAEAAQGAACEQRQPTLWQRAASFARSIAVTEPVARRRELAADIVQLVGIPAVFFVLWFVPVSPTLVGAHERLGLPPCTMRTLLGIPCPGCGATTGIILLLHGQVGLAFLASLLAPPVFLGLVCVWAKSAYAVLFRRRVIVLRGPAPGRAAVYVFAFVMVAWVYKIATYFYIMHRISEGTWPLCSG